MRLECEPQREDWVDQKQYGNPLHCIQAHERLREACQSIGKKEFEMPSGYYAF